MQTLWACTTQAAPARAETKLPTGTAQLIVDLRSGHAFVEGPQTGPRTLLRGGAGWRGVGIALRAGAVRRFLGVPAGELRDRLVPLADLWRPADAARLGELLGAARTEQEALTLLGSQLQHRARPSRCDARVRMALRAVHAEPSAFRVRAWSRRLHLSERHLHALFVADVGVGPKRYARLRRFQSVLECLGRSPEDLGTVAHRCGYADQGHLAREFRAFSGTSPSAYRLRAPLERNHL